MAKGSLAGRSGTNPVVGTPPNPVAPSSPLTPIQKLKNLMEVESWMFTQSFVQWGEVWENTRAGLVTPYSEDSRMVMLAPITFFNAHPATVGFFFGKIVDSFMHMYGQYMTDEIYAQTHPMPWIVLESFAPAFARQDKGHDAHLEAWRLIREMKDSGQHPLEGSEQPAPARPARHAGQGNNVRAGQAQ